MAVESFTKENLKAIDAEIAQAVKAVAEKHGFTVKLGGGSFSPTEATVKLLLKVEGGDKVSFERYAELVGLTPADFGRKVRLNNEEFEIVGINLRARQYPINAKRVRDGKVFKLNESAVKQSLDADRGKS